MSKTSMLASLPRRSAFTSVLMVTLGATLSLAQTPETPQAFSAEKSRSAKITLMPSKTIPGKNSTFTSPYLGQARSFLS
jgi:hypothetical protein